MSPVLKRYNTNFNMITFWWYEIYPRVFRWLNYHFNFVCYIKVLPFRWNHSGRPIALTYLPCRVYRKEILFTYLFIYLFVVSIAREREKGAGFMKNPGIITFKLPWSKLHGFFPERLYLRRMCAYKRVLLPHCLSPIWDFFAFVRRVRFQAYSTHSHCAS